MKEFFQLKSFKSVESLSEETLCFTGNLYYKGKRICQVSNRGHGGCNEYSPYKGYDQKFIQELNEVARKITDSEFEPLDSLVDDLIEDIYTNKYIKKVVKKGYPYVVNVYEKKEALGEKYNLLIRNEAYLTKEIMDEQIKKNPELVYKVVHSP